MYDLKLPVWNVIAFRRMIKRKERFSTTLLVLYFVNFRVNFIGLYYHFLSAGNFKMISFAREILEDQHCQVLDLLF